jgi:hypothetical protein
MYMRCQESVIPGGSPLPKPGLRAIALVLSVLLLAAVLLGSVHHHGDGDDHPDCAVCAVVHHHSADAAVPAPVLLRLPVAIATLFLLRPPAAIAGRTNRSQHDRAPPR